MAREPTPTRAHYRHFTPLGTRWMDNDVYGHVNNVTYYSYFDTAVNEYLIRAGVLDIHGGAVIGLVVETGCRYFTPVAFPDQLDIGIAVTKLGNSSVRYEVGIFRQGVEEAAAAGHFIHVYVDRENRRPTPLPAGFRAALEKLLVGE
ncbi:acyl-CoA thioesterase [Niveispirillum sp. SYP-B3756]|uniref:acyl-CoA thioesterase n=1 Tax=Niveispirillum sp. SYP-B3756 TaxID=2662178 RepID=UPI0012909857|nr:thioesterase family protein [Niveispirillum sp. SYP-B3756]MQP66516.1 acyl-CoA thioesterase [Niveispirillum sp. SYP-B3756]